MKIEEWVATQTLLLLNSTLTRPQQSDALSKALVQAYEQGVRDGELQSMKERMYPPGLYPVMPPPPPPRGPERPLRNVRPSKKRT